MKFSLRVNNDLAPDELIRLAHAAEDAGFAQLWVSNDMFLRSAPALAGALAAETETLELGIAIMNPYSVHVGELAMVAATMQELTEGRFLLGVGAGSEEFLGWAGLARPRPLATTAWAVQALRHLLGHAGVDRPDGLPEAAHLRFDLPAPVPVYVGGMGPKMLELAGRLADGALPLLYPPTHFVVARAQIMSGLLAAGRDPDELDLAACFWLSLSDDADSGRAALAEKLAYYGTSISPYLLAEAGLTPQDFAAAAARAQRGERAADLVDRRMLSLGVAGGVPDVLAQCRALIELGARHLSFGPPLGPDTVTAARLLGDEVLPVLRADVPDAVNL